MVHIPIIRTSHLMQMHISQPHWGKIHSIYRNTVNLILDNQLISLQTASSPLSPISVILPMDAEDLGKTIYDPSGHCLCRNKIITIRQETSCFSGNSISLYLNTDTDVCCTKLLPSDKVSPEIMESCLIAAETILMTCERKGFAHLFCIEYTGQNVLPGFDSAKITDPVLKAAWQSMDTARQLVAKQRWSEAAEVLCQLIGLGSGLTPSGDDFLCGFLACLQSFFPDNHIFASELAAKIQKNLPRTNDISRAFLECALHGEYSTAILSFFQKVLSYDPATLSELKKSFLAIGHSSGLDSLCGICYGLRLSLSHRII